MKETKWYLISSYGSNNYEATYLEEYVNEEGTLCKQVWGDGREEIFNLFD